MHTLYVGSSWAVQSFESLYGIDDPVKTNLAQELELTNYTSLAMYSKSNLELVNHVQRFMIQHPELAPFRVMFITGSSLNEDCRPTGEIVTGETVAFAKSFLTSDDPIGIVKNLEKRFNQHLNKLDVPVALIGAGTDVTCESHDNITVIHPSWQNFLGQRCGLNSFYGWPANFGRKWLAGTIVPEIGPPEHFKLDQPASGTVARETHKIKVFWKTMQHHNLLIGGHPTILGNQLFAQEIKQSVNDWIDIHQ